MPFNPSTIDRSGEILGQAFANTGAIIGQGIDKRAEQKKKLKMLEAMNTIVEASPELQKLVGKEFDAVGLGFEGTEQVFKMINQVAENQLRQQQIEISNLNAKTAAGNLRKSEIDATREAHEAEKLRLAREQVADMVRAGASEEDVASFLIETSLEDPVKALSILPEEEEAPEVPTVFTAEAVPGLKSDERLIPSGFKLDAPEVEKPVQPTARTRSILEAKELARQALARGDKKEAQEWAETAAFQQKGSVTIRDDNTGVTVTASPGEAKELLAKSNVAKQQEQMIESRLAMKMGIDLLHDFNVNAAGALGNIRAAIDIPTGFVASMTGHAIDFTNEELREQRQQQRIFKQKANIIVEKAGHRLLKSQLEAMDRILEDPSSLTATAGKLVKQDIEKVTDALIVIWDSARINNGQASILKDYDNAARAFKSGEISEETFKFLENNYFEEQKRGPRKGEVLPKKR